MEGKEQKKDNDTEKVQVHFHPSFKIIFVLGVIFGNWIFRIPPIKDELVHWYLGYEYDSDEDCVIVRQRQRSRDYCRPLIDCDQLCVNVTQIDVVDNLDQDTFLKYYAYTGRPVVIRNATSSWKAVQTFSFEYFRDLYKNLSSPVLYNDEADCQFFAWDFAEFRNMYHVFSMPESRYAMKNNYTPWYIGWANCDDKAMEKLRTQYTRPEFLPEFSRSGRRDWIFMGTPGYGAPLHLDDVLLPSWQAQIAGVKMWTLKPPPECRTKCHGEMSTIQEPGDIIVLNTNEWYHSTNVLDHGLSITITNEYD